MTNSLICQSCHTENPSGVTLCQKCGAPIVPLLQAALSTEPVPQRPIQPTETNLQARAIEVPELRGKGIALVIRGHENPVMIQGSDIILGRYDPGSSLPTVDLTPFNAGGMGVSRRHARIQAQHDIHLIEDLNSTNGTWVNQQRLPAGKQQGLQNGDLIQLGQLVLRVYFDAASAMRSVEERISFKTPSAQFTPHFLATRLSPYLTALTEVQAICDEILQRARSEIEISSISLEEARIITVQVSGAREALRLAKGHLKTWRKDNVAKINQFLKVSEVVSAHTGVMRDTGETMSAPSGDEQLARLLGQELREGEIKVAFDFLREIAPQHDGDDRTEYVARLLKPINVMAFSPLNVTTGSNSLAH